MVKGFRLCSVGFKGVQFKHIAPDGPLSQTLGGGRGGRDLTYDVDNLRL